MVHTSHMTTSRGRDTGRALTEIRTVRSRAETALSDIQFNGEGTPGKYVETGEVHIGPKGQEYRPVEFVQTGPPRFDPDREEMVAALQAFIDATEKWKKTGKATRHLDQVIDRD